MIIQYTGKPMITTVIPPSMFQPARRFFGVW